MFTCQKSNCTAGFGNRLGIFIVLLSSLLNALQYEMMDVTVWLFVVGHQYMDSPS
jgi:hypothetical protein